MKCYNFDADMHMLLEYTFNWWDRKEHRLIIVKETKKTVLKKCRLKFTN